MNVADVQCQVLVQLHTDLVNVADVQCQVLAQHGFTTDVTAGRVTLRIMNFLHVIVEVVPKS